MTRTFDKKFGDTFLDSVPHEPGVYRFFDGDGALVYVGKAKDLHRRLSRYRNVRRIKAHRKRRRVVKASARLEFEVTEDEEAALLLENALIQEHRPRLNVVGAFTFLYPFIGLKRTRRHLHVVYTTDLQELRPRGFEPFGCYRNRKVARAGFEALVSVFDWLGHVERVSDPIPYATCRRFRQIPDTLDGDLRDFLRGESKGFLQSVVMLLLEKPAARRDAAEVQASLKALKRFFGHEGRRLKRLRDTEGVDVITQEERDPADIRADFES